MINCCASDVKVLPCIVVTIGVERPQASVKKPWLPEQLWGLFWWFVFFFSVNL